MNSKTALAISSALWLTMLPTTSFAQKNPLLPDISTSEQAQIFLNAGNLTTIEPLYLSFHPQQVTLEEENMKILAKWLERVGKSDIPIHVYSYATPPTSRRDITTASSRHMAIRKAFNRAIEAKNALEASGISEKLIALHAIGPDGENRSDQLRITLRAQ
jgi:hypothetical protein